MSKRARQMALMGFFQGALSDVMRNRENRRLEEAEARKEARLAAIRAQERGEDREFTREQFAAQQVAMDKRDERNFDQQKEFFSAQSAQADKRDERNFDQQRQLAAESRAASAAESAANRAHSEKLANMRTPAERAPNLQSFVNESTGKVVTFNVNDAEQVAKLKQWQSTQPIKPYNAVYGREMGDEQGIGLMGAPAAPRSADMRYDPKTGRLVPVGR